VALELLDSGRTAIDRIRKGGVAGLLLDMSMPGLDGYDTARRIRALPEGRQLPILAMTSWVGPEEEARCLEAGCTAYLEKPLRRDVLTGAIKRLLDRKLEVADDRGGMAETRVLVDPLLADLVPDYLEGRIHDVATLRSALDQGDLEAIRVLAHNLAGSGEAYGFTRLTELGRALENVIVSGDREEASAWIGEIERYLDSVEWEAEADAAT
jgi:CheY-like chemotaxis protein/HPt (histidine-containing phosphotransfer) domain-containing protein